MIQQQFKGLSLTRTKVRNQIIRFYENETTDADKFDWYADAKSFAVNLSTEFDVPANVVCGLIAALSPVKQWNQNKNCVLSLLLGNGGKHMKQFVDKAQRILELDDATDTTILDVLNGRKISAFYLNIMHPNRDEVVTIDRHALSIALGHWVTDEEYSGMTAKQYAFFVECYQLAAKKLNINGLLLQSSTWVAWRKKTDKKRK